MDDLERRDGEKPPQPAAEESAPVPASGLWWRIALVGFAALLLLIALLQALGGPAGTAVVPGTPVSAPQERPAG